MGGTPQQDFILNLIGASPWHRAALADVARLGLPDAWIGAGFVRALVWDHLHGFARPTPVNDVDVIFFDPDDVRPEREAELEALLRTRAPAYPWPAYPWPAYPWPAYPWSVRNQARMHRRNGDRPYRSTRDAITHWLETPTAVAVRLGDTGRLELLAPLGVEDLVTLCLRPTPHARAHRLDAYRARLASKPWRTQWPRLTVCES